MGFCYGQGCGLGTEPAGKESPGVSDQAQLLLLRFPEKLHFFLEACIACRKNVAIAISSLEAFGVMINLSFGQRGTEGIFLQLRNAQLNLPLLLLLCRKGTLLINNLFSIAAAILMGTSELAKTFEVIILSRVVMGIFAGKWMGKAEQ